MSVLTSDVLAAKCSKLSPQLQQAVSLFYLQILLSPVGPHQHSSPYTIEAPLKKKVVETSDIVPKRTDVLFVPKAKNNPFYDSFMGPNNFIQVTTANRHDAKGDGFVKACVASFLQPPQEKGIVTCKL